jgi:hypothetical protein
MQKPFQFYYFMPFNPDPSEQPYQKGYDSLVEAAEEAWRMNSRSGWRAVKIEEGDAVVFDEVALARICERVNRLDAEQPGCEPREMIERVLSELGLVGKL